MSKNSILLKGADLTAIRAYYEKERNDLLVKLQKIDQVFSALGAGEGRVPSNAPVKLRVSKPTTEAAGKRGRPKKRGPKSVWGDFIMRRLRQSDRPLSYNELIRDAMIMHNLPDGKLKEARSSILNATFRLRTVAGKIDTKGIEGRKERFIVLTTWLAEGGDLMPAYQEKFNELARLPEELRGQIARRGTAPTEDMAKVHSRMTLTPADIVRGDEERAAKEVAEALLLKERAASGKKSLKVSAKPLKAPVDRSAKRIVPQKKRGTEKVSFQADLEQAKSGSKPKSTAKSGTKNEMPPKLKPAKRKRVHKKKGEKG
jgi:hypothetical protein